MRACAACRACTARPGDASARDARPPPPPAAPLDAGTTRRAAPPPPHLLGRRGALTAAGVSLSLLPQQQAARALSLPTAASLFRAQPTNIAPTVDPAFASLVRAAAQQRLLACAGARLPSCARRWHRQRSCA
jgi:hypothetical protein